MQEDFNLQNNDEALEFLRRIYNHSLAMADLRSDLDLEKVRTLKEIKAAGAGMTSLTSAAKATPSSKNTSEPRKTMPSISEQDGVEWYDNGDIQNMLETRDYERPFIVHGVRADFACSRC